MLTRSMVRGMKDIPFEVLCDILERCSGGNIYKLAVLRAVNRTFKASVAMIGSSLAIADMQCSYSTGVSHAMARRLDDVVKGVLEQCPNVVGLLLLSRQEYSVQDFSKLLSFMPNTLCILQMHQCHLSYEVLFEIGQALTHLQGLAMCNAHVYNTGSAPWNGFPQLKILRVDSMRSVCWEALQPLRGQLAYLSCHWCMHIMDGICNGLDSCVALDLGRINISDDGLQNLLNGGAPNLKLLLLSAKSGNSWEDGKWTAAIVERMEKRGIKVIQSAGYGENAAAVEECLQDPFRNSPQVLKYAAEYLL